MSNLGGIGPKTLVLGRLDGRLIDFDGDADLMTIGPNRSGRDRSSLIPNLLTYAGPAVVIDLNGEVYAATAEARRRMGHTVVRLDPFAVTGPESDGLNPMDLADGLEGPALDSACQDIADLIPLRNSFGDFGEYEAFGLLSGVISYLAVVPDKRSFDQVYSTLHSDDVVYTLAVVLDTVGKKIPKMSYAEISGYLQKEDKLRSSLLTKLTSHLKALSGREVQQSLSQSTVPLSEMRSGAPVTVYIIIPPERLAIHSVLLRIWIGTLLHNELKAQEGSSPPTLFLLDHCAEIGRFPFLASMLSTGSGKAFRIWTFWHDVHQLRTTYPGDWPAIVSGCGAVQVLGTKDAAAAAEAEALLGLAANDVWSLGAGEQIVAVDGVPVRARKLDPRDDIPASAAEGDPAAFTAR